MSGTRAPHQEQALRKVTFLLLYPQLVPCPLQVRPSQAADLWGPSLPYRPVLWKERTKPGFIFNCLLYNIKLQK